MADNDVGLLLRNRQGRIVKFAQMPIDDAIGDDGVMDYFWDNVALMSNEKPLPDPTGMTAIGYEHLPWPHDAYCVNNPTPRLGQYVYPYEDAVEYLKLDGLPHDASEAVMLGKLRALLDRFPRSALPTPQTKPKIVVDLTPRHAVPSNLQRGFLNRPKSKRACWRAQAGPPQRTQFGVFPNWRDLDEMQELPFDLANGLRKAMYGCIDKIDVAIMDDPVALAARVAKQPMGTLYQDSSPLSLQSVDPTPTFMAMTDAEFAKANFDDVGAYEALRAMRQPGGLRGTKSVQEWKQLAEAEARKTVSWRMPDNTSVSVDVGSAYGSRLLAKVEAALGWTRDDPAFSDPTAEPPAGRAPPVAAAAAEMAVAAEREQRLASERARRKAIHDAMMEAAEAEEKARVARRKAQASAVREARAEAPPQPYTPRRAPPASSKAAKKAARQARRNNAQVQIVHEVHVSPEQKEIRSARAEANKEAAHWEAVAAKAKRRADGMRKLAADASAAREAATHVVPPPMTLGGAVGAAIDVVVDKTTAATSAVGLV
jgi:hypothetical protein